MSRTVSLTIDGQSVTVAEGTSLLEACRSLGLDIPTLCWAANLTPVNACRMCVVELEGARPLVLRTERIGNGCRRASCTLNVKHFLISVRFF